MPRSPLVLIILDGFGINPKKEGNAIYLANHPTLKGLEEGNHSQLLTSGEVVGLPPGQMGNSEVGHTNIGSGRIVYQDYTRINKSIKEGDFFRNESLKKIFSNVNKNNSKLHFLGLVSDGGVHSHIDHLFALLKFAKQEGVKKIFIHAFLDGRDTAHNIASLFVQQLENFLRKETIGKIATVSGRYYAMDRDKRWDRIQKTYEALTEAKGLKTSSSLLAIQEALKRGETDEFVQPTIIDSSGVIEDQDTVLFFNFRADRTRQLTQAFTLSDFQPFQRRKVPHLFQFVTMTQYDKKFSLPIIFQPLHLKNILGEILSREGIPQLRIAETEKYAHVTFFFNGGEEKAFPGEERILIPSPREVPTYDLKPQMSSLEITETVLKNIERNEFGFTVLNFANADMVGHTGNLSAAIRAVEVLDECIAKILAAVQKKKGHLLISADHGNIEQMIHYDTGKPHTSHTTNPVPFYYVSPNRKRVKLKDGILADIMPTILHLLDLPTPVEVTGKNLIASS